MEIMKAIGKELKEYINMRAKNFALYDYDYFWSSIIEKTEEELLQNNPYVVINDNKVVAWANVVNYFTTSIVYIMDIFGVDNVSAIKLFSEAFPNAIFCGESHEDMINAGLVVCNDKASNFNQSYIFSNGNYPYTNGNENILRDIFESQYVWMETDNIDEIEFLDLSTKEISKLVNNNADSFLYYPYARNEGNFYIFPGFHYFRGSEDFYGNDDIHFLIAKDKNSKKVAGVIRYGEWPYTKGTTSIAYIDVSYNARNKGLARRLIKELYKVIDHTKPFRIGRLSEMGEKVKIDEIFKSEMKDIRFVD